MEQLQRDAAAVNAIQVTGETVEAEEVFGLDLHAGQFTSPSVALAWGGHFVGIVANVANAVRFLVFEYDEKGEHIDTHEAKKAGFKVEGPGAAIVLEGDDMLCYVTAHATSANPDGSRRNVLLRARFAGLAAPPAYDGPFADEGLMGPHRDNVYSVVEHGLMSADREKWFNPGTALPRMQVASILARILRIKRRQP